MKNFIKKIKDFFKKTTPKQTVLYLISIFIAVIMFINLTTSSGESETINTKLYNASTSVNYVEFQKMLVNKEIEEIYINFNEADFNYLDNNDNPYKTANPRVDGFKESLLLNSVNVVEYENPNLFQYISPILTVFLILMIMRNLGGALGGGSDIQIAKDTDKYSFDRVAGNQESSEDMKQLIDFLKNPQKYHDMNAKMPKGVILQGPPGTGKTLTAKAMAGEANVPFISVNGAQFVDMFVGKGARTVRALFKHARKHAPCIVFIDEIDAVAKKRGGMNSHDEKDQTINALLSELDGFKGTEGILVMVATNRADVLDEAFIRPGRFDKKITIGLPNVEDRESIFKHYLKDRNIDKIFDLKKWAKDTTGVSGAFIESFVNEASLEAVKHDRDIILNEDFEEAFYKIIMEGSKRKSHTRTPEVNKMIAWHEAGHALVAKLTTGEEVRKVTIIPSTSGAEGVAIRNGNEDNIKTIEYYEGNVMITMGGRVAEELLAKDFKKVSSGAYSDIKQSTDVLYQMIAELGMYGENRFVNLDKIGYDKKELNEKIIKKSEELYDKTKNLLTDNLDLLEKIANALIEKESLDDELICEIMNNHKAS